MGIFSFLKIDPNKQAARLEKRANKKMNKAQELMDRAIAVAPVVDDITMDGTSPEGRPVQVRAKIKGLSSRLNQYVDHRFKPVNREIAELHGKIEELDEWRDQFEAEMQSTGLAANFMSTGVAAALRAAVQLINQGDKVHYPVFLSIESSLEAIQHNDMVEGAPENLIMSVRAFLTAAAYYDAGVGFSSVMQRDPTDETPAVSTVPPEVQEIRDLAVRMESQMEALTLAIDALRQQQQHSPPSQQANDTPC